MNLACERMKLPTVVLVTDFWANVYVPVLLSSSLLHKVSYLPLLPLLPLILGLWFCLTCRLHAPYSVWYAGATSYLQCVSLSQSYVLLTL